MAQYQPDIYKAATLEELDGLADIFLSKFPRPEIFAVEGEMGAGKTTLIRAICEKLGIAFNGSPTFALVNAYVTEKGVPFHHFDLYRLESTAEALDFGFEEYLDAGGYVFIEWPDLVLKLLPKHSKTIHIRDTGEYREISF